MEGVWPSHFLAFTGILAVNTSKLRAVQIGD